MGKPLVYFARRVEHSDPAEDLLREDALFMDYQDIKRAYLNKNVEYKDFIKGGSWLFPPNRGVKEVQDRRITPFGVWDILKSKIEVCDIVVALVSKDAFGTIVEAAYAAGKGNSAVYVFPAPGVEIDEQEELWFPFNLSLSTKKMWKRQHFEMEGLFPVETTMEEYEARIRCITPNFLKRHSDE